VIDAYLCDAVRTPIGRYGGSLASVRTDDLGAVPIRALLERNATLICREIDDVWYGCANQAGEDNRNVARMSALLAGLPPSVPGVTVNRLCGSGMDAIGSASRAIKAGEVSLAIAGGVESMTRAPFVMAKSAQPYSRESRFYDTTIGWRFVNELMSRQYGIDSMPETAENVAAEFDVSREDQDLFALGSQQKAAAARQLGVFDDEIVPVHVSGRPGEERVVDRDEHPRPDSSLAALASLRAPFRANGTVTAGNASGLNDGACAVLLANEKAAMVHGLAPKGRVLSMAVSGIEPRIMGVGPIEAGRKALAMCGLSIADMDVIELNEAFAAQALAVMRAWGLADDDARVNPNGGAIALGHPLGMSGARLVTTALYQLGRSGGRYALCSMCVGVGQGIALVIERV
jgi:acetyl-CoA acyltransferase